MRDVMDGHPEKVFVAITPPLLNPVATDAEAAAWARTFVDGLKSDGYLSGDTNIFTFDFFDCLAEADPTYGRNMLRADYREGEDYHPNRIANKAIGPLLVDFGYQAVYDSESPD